MVRNARFSWDDTDDFDLPERGFRIDDLDDPVTAPEFHDDDEGELSQGRSQPRHKPGDSQRPPTRPSEKRESRCHLAGADWLRDAGLDGNRNGD